MSNCEDDLVNLGPFMQNYVLNANRSLGMPGPLNPTSEKTYTPMLFPNKQTCASDYVGNVQCGPPVKKKCVRVMTVSKSRKSNRLTEKQQRVKKWLQSAYVFCPRAKTLKLSSHVVLMRACRVFGPMTHKALVFLVQQAFPYVKISMDTDGNGHFFSGIMDKPNEAATYRRTRYWNNALKELDLKNDGTSNVDIDLEVVTRPSRQAKSLAHERIAEITTEDLPSSPGIELPESPQNNQDIKPEPVDQGYESHNSETSNSDNLLVKHEPLDNGYEKPSQLSDSEATLEDSSDTDCRTNPNPNIESHFVFGSCPSITFLSSASVSPRTSSTVQDSRNSSILAQLNKPALTSNVNVIPTAPIIPFLSPGLLQLSQNGGKVQNLSPGVPVLGSLQNAPVPPQSNLLEAQSVISNLVTFIQHREARFKNLQAEFSNLSNEFRKLTHLFKAFEQEGTGLAFLSASNNDG